MKKYVVMWCYYGMLPDIYSISLYTCSVLLNQPSVSKNITDSISIILVISSQFAFTRRMSLHSTVDCGMFILVGKQTLQRHLFKHCYMYICVHVNQRN